MTDKTAAQREPAFNTRFCEALRQVTDWGNYLQAETRNLFSDSLEIPDAFLSKPGFPPVVFECKFENSNGDPIADAEKKLGLKCSANAGISAGGEVRFAVAVRYPEKADQWQESEVVQQLLTSEGFWWKFLRISEAGEVGMWPENGLLSGGLPDLAESVARTVASAEQISALSETTFGVIDEAAAALAAVLENQPEEVERIAELMGIPENVAKTDGKVTSQKTETENG